jgi:hypothetical protein
VRFLPGEMFSKNCSVSGAMSQHCLSVTMHKEKNNKLANFGCEIYKERNHLEE